ncbi:MAG: DUF4382 domain-containing protein [Gracilimonas sp.]|uniref:DUF4382 domain-containing protein n=1 Tax=Gracilimonas TaxID=649462 RepID=UPI001B22264F|nr:DUF4382 domain-containing protein [Gracilimonas sp.]MBO6587183.1 DUF4382 domain-containing protein [Gracilimonas sp.]MBO6614329.1 DUF4382 domain-containing protein [Gracilimonas sp.]
MKISLTDAPAAYDEVNIEIRQVLVNQDEDAEDPDSNGEENDEGEEDGGAEDNGWYSILDDSMTVNLLDYQNGNTLELGETELEAGQYNQIRLILGDNNNVVIDGETYNLSTPSAQQSGFKLLVNATVEEDQVYELVIDFDASQSIVETGNGNYILKPVLRTVDLEEQASISGTVLPVEAEPFVYAIVGQDTVGTQPDEEGNFKLVGLEDATYNVSFNPTNDAYADSLVEGIELEDGEEFEFEETIELESSGVLN